MSSYHTVLVGIDFGELGDTALAAAVDFANRVRAERIHLVHVVPSISSWSIAGPRVSMDQFELAWDAAVKLQDRRLRDWKVPVTNCTVTYETRVGNTVRELVECAKASHANLIVIAGGKHSKLGGFLIGSVANGVLRASHCPVLIVGEARPGTTPIKSVLAAVDTSSVAKLVIARAVELAALEKASLRIFSVQDAGPMIESLHRSLPRGSELTTPEIFVRVEAEYRRRLDELVESVPRAAAARPELEIVTDQSPARAIIRAAKSTATDAVVIGTSGHSVWRRMFLGSTATRVVHEAPCPILIVPAGTD